MSEVIAVVVGVGVAAVLCGSLAASFILLPGRGRSTAAGEGERRRQGLRRERGCDWPPLFGEVLFAARLRPRAVGLDCLVSVAGSAHGGGRSPVGHPVYVPAVGAPVALTAASLDEIALMWLAEGRRVSIELVCLAGEFRARLSDGSSTVILDIVQPETVTRQVLAFAAPLSHS